MCAVSKVIDDWTRPSSPNFVPPERYQGDPMLAWQMLEALRKLEAIDKRLGLLEQCKFTQAQKRKFKKKLRNAASKET